MEDAIPLVAADTLLIPLDYKPNQLSVQVVGGGVRCAVGGEWEGKISWLMMPSCAWRTVDTVVLLGLELPWENFKAKLKLDL